MVRQCGTSRKWIRSNGRSEVVGATLRGELGAGVEGEWEAETEAEAEGEAGGVPLIQGHHWHQSFQIREKRTCQTHVTPYTPSWS